MKKTAALGFRSKYMHITLICLCLAVFSAASASAASTVTFYRDGALYQQDVSAKKGVIDVPLAAGLLESTLTVIPAAGSTILEVETLHNRIEGTASKEMEALVEQRRKLEDRLQALETREAIFTAAAKTQSGKAPRKTKTNPDPMQAIRQGTDYAIAQLEAVYTARRRAMQEIKRIEALLAATEKGNSSSKHSVKITVTPANGRVTLRYATSERGWQTHYDLHLTGDGTARLELSARAIESRRGYQVRVSPAPLAESGKAKTFPLQSGKTTMGSYLLPITVESSIEGVYNSFSGTITNNSPDYLPSGESGLFRKGAYVGRFVFAGMSSGRSRTVSIGR